MKKIQSLQHAINRKRYLERLLSQMPDEAYYVGGSCYAEDAVERQNLYNEILAEEIIDEIKKCERYINKTRLKSAKDI